jgi:hypothetical protein
VLGLLIMAMAGLISVDPNFMAMVQEYTNNPTGTVSAVLDGRRMDFWQLKI